MRCLPIKKAKKDHTRAKAQVWSYLIFSQNLVKMYFASMFKCCAEPFKRPKNGLKIGGKGGIRTHGGFNTSLVFKTRAFNRSATFPRSLKEYNIGCGLCQARGFVNLAGGSHPGLLPWCSRGIPAGWLVVPGFESGCRLPRRFCRRGYNVPEHLRETGSA